MYGETDKKVSWGHTFFQLTTKINEIAADLTSAHFNYPCRFKAPFTSEKKSSVSHFFYLCLIRPTADRELGTNLIFFRPKRFL